MTIRSYTLSLILICTLSRGQTRFAVPGASVDGGGGGCAGGGEVAVRGLEVGSGPGEDLLHGARPHAGHGPALGGGGGGAGHRDSAPRYHQQRCSHSPLVSKISF